ncbi:MAG: RsiV family protein [Muribaculum sp.]|nr:RsiV family protein [Muribaculum sp.]
MKKATGFFPFLAVSALILGACTNKKADSSRMEFEAYDYSVVTQQTDVDSTLPAAAHYWHQVGTGLLPVASADNPAISQLRDSLMALGRVNFSSDGKAFIASAPDFKTTDLKPDSVDCGSGSASILSIVLANPKVIVWESYYHEYPYMAAHGSSDYSYLNYSVADGKILDLSDLMKKGYEPSLTAMIREQLKANDNLIVPIDKIGIPANWRIAPSGIEFVWEPYEIAPYSEGVIRVLIQTDDLETILSQKAIGLLDPASF